MQDTSNGSGRHSHVCSAAEPRVLLYSQRNWNHHVSRCGFYEFEELIRRLDHVDLIAPAASSRRMGGGAERCIVAALRRLGYDCKPRLGPSKARVERDYDLFFAILPTPFALDELRGLEGWRERCRTRVCWIDEFWVNQLGYRRTLERLRQFDQIYLVCSQTVRPLEQAVGRQCFYGAPATDALKFSSFTQLPVRSIDVYSMGSCQPNYHPELLRLHEEDSLYYLFDSGEIVGVRRPLEHRTLVSGLIRRSRFFLVNLAAAATPGKTGGQEEAGPRYFEGAAGGAVLLGRAPDCEAYREMFPDVDSVIELPDDPSDLGDLLEDLCADPAHLEAIGRRNVVRSLLVHDWSHRWEQVLANAGLEPLPAIDERRAELERVADRIDAGAIGTDSGSIAEAPKVSR